jgi:aldose 1-epimerase
MKTALVFVMVSLSAMTLPAADTKSGVQKSSFGKLADGREISLYTLSNGKGMEVAITNYGATVVRILVPDRSGKPADIALGYDDVSGYVSDKSFFGATIGRYGNRIAKGQFSLAGKTYHLPTNDGPNTLHGGTEGFNKRVWEAKVLPGAALQMSYLSPDGEQGFPGNLHVTVTFTVTPRNELRIEYLATTDQDTVVNLTNHTYFDLAGQRHGDILKHTLLLHAARFTPVDATLIPTGELRAVKGTPFDFTTAHVIGERIDQPDEQLKFGRGYDHNWVLEAGVHDGRSVAAEAYDPSSGRVLQVLTTEPGIQFYSGNFLDGTVKGKGGYAYPHRSGFCLETQHFPDSPNHANFPSTELKPGQRYHTTTVYRFSTR